MNATLLRLAALVLPFGFFAATADGMMLYSQTQSGGVGFPSVEPVVLTFTDAPPAASDATLSLVATGGELNLNGKRLEQLLVDGASFETPNLPGGHPAGSVLPTNRLNILDEIVEPVTIPEAVLNGFVADGMVEVSVVRPGFIAGGTFDFVLSYTSAIPEPGSLMLLASFGVVALLNRR